ncbi:MAG: hypothetical protein IJX13_06550, partial [Clostridia bacterium]|nr:hypothetical protein [Clostridia bacterium]
MSKGMKFWIVIGAIVLMLTLLLPALVSVRNRLDEAKETEEKPAVTTATADSEGSERETESQTAAILTAKLYSYAESEADLEGDPAHVITFEEGMTWAEWV